MSNVILADIEDHQKIIKEEKEEWIYQVLVALGVPESLIVDSSNEEIIGYLTAVEIEVFDHLGKDSVEISRAGKVVAEWKPPKLMRKIGDDGKHYYEIHFNEWALPFQMSRRGK
jgi:hypothetical protein